MRLTEEQLQAVERRDGPLLVRAGAGTGKTTVLVERFVRAVAEDDVPVDAMLAITFTDKAAAEMRTRVRRRLLELGRTEDARAAESASISTIHAFCARLLRAQALSAGIDPEFRLLDELEAERLAGEAFDRALEDFLGAAAGAPIEGGERLELVASYTADALRDMVRTAHAHLRSRGQSRPRLAATQAPDPAGQAERLEAAARAALGELAGAGDGAQVASARTAMERCLGLLERLEPGLPAEPGELAGLGARGGARVLSTPACEEYGAALDAYRDLCVARREHLDHELLRVLLDSFHRRLEEAKRERSALDFEDLQLIARDLLAGDAGLREQVASRYAHVLVDEFQDVNPLQSELIELIAPHNLFRVGDENQAIYGFRHADVSVFRRARELALAAGRSAGITENFRSRGELLDAIDLAFRRAFGGDFEPLREAPGRAGRSCASRPWTSS
jgi:ATP-dependent exoDNAse (exonuclease V) beta subunit